MNLRAFWDYFLLAFNNLRHRGLRSLLTIIGIFIGIAAVVALVALGNGLQDTISNEFAKIGADKITIMGYNGIAASPFVSSTLANPLTEDDVKVVQRVRGVATAGGILMESITMEVKRESKIGLIYTLPEDDSREIIEDMVQAEVTQGRLLRAGESGRVLIGSYLANGVFEHELGVGDSIKLNGKTYTVVGTLKSMGNQIDDSVAILNTDDARRLLNEPKMVSMIYAQTESGVEPAKVAESIKEKLRKHRGVKEDAEDFQASTSEQLASSFSTIFGIVQAIVVGIAAISLLVGGVGIMNTMYTSVIERTKEIGVMKAVGAQNSDVLLIFLIESGMLGLVGGILGVLTGIGLSKTAEIIASQALGSDLFKAAVTPELIFGALLFSFVLGSLSGVLPARQAAKLKPADALRY
ncbi:MAG: ABC transporter permease [Candidatus Micrarchaeota archaeon]